LAQFIPFCVFAKISSQILRLFASAASYARKAENASYSVITGARQAVPHGQIRNRCGFPYQGLFITFGLAFA
jgi:hypothetical protein